MSIKSNWNYPTAVRIGAGRIAELAQAVRAAGMTKPLLVTDEALAHLPITARAMDVMKADGLDPGIFSGVRANPTDENLEDGLKIYRAGGYDGVVAFGGGSALDLAKCIAFMSGQKRPVWDFEDIGDWWTRAVPAGIAPVVAVPTTAGTGSEVGRAGVIVDTAKHVKKVIFHPKMMPVTVICDPELTVGMPSFITVGTGLDAFAHCLEAYCAPGYHPLAEGIAIEGIRLVKENLPRVFAKPDDLDARANMMSAAAMGATAFQKGLGGVHALTHPIGALYDTHHGMTTAVTMPGVLSCNRPAIEDRIKRLADYIGVAGGFDGFFAWVLALQDSLNVPKSLTAFKVPRDGFDQIVEMAIVDPTAGGNPIPLTRELAAEMLARDFEGDYRA